MFGKQAEYLKNTINAAYVDTFYHRRDGSKNLLLNANDFRLFLFERKWLTMRRQS